MMSEELKAKLDYIKNNVLYEHGAYNLVINEQNPITPEEAKFLYEMDDLDYSIDIGIPKVAYKDWMLPAIDKMTRFTSGVCQHIVNLQDDKENNGQDDIAIADSTQDVEENIEEGEKKDGE